MAKLSNTTKGKNTTVNKEGHKAYELSNRTKITSQVLTTFFNEKKFYGDNSKDIKDLATLMCNESKEEARFIANLAVYTRNEQNLRTVSQVLVVILANTQYGKIYAKEAIFKTCKRVDDMVNILSYQLSKYGKPVPNSMKKGLAMAFRQFDEYQLAKYNRKEDVKLIDILRICHIKPTDKDMSDMFKSVIEGTLETPYTWETELQAKGNNKETWEELIDSNRVGYMATMRNLGNMLKNDVDDEHMQKVYSYLTNKNAVSKSKQLPFRYYSAYKEIQNRGTGTTKTFDALEDAIELSIDNIDNLEGFTVIAGDTSGSMGWTVSDKSDVTCADISALMLNLSTQICDDSIALTFDTTCRKHSISKRGGIIGNSLKMSHSGGGTDCSSVIQYMITNKIRADRIIMISDNESNDQFNRKGYYSSRKTVQELLDKYKKEINPDVWFHAIDIMGYGTSQVMEGSQRVNLMSGWSEKTLQYISMVEKGTYDMVKHIENYEFI